MIWEFCLQHFSQKRSVPLFSFLLTQMGWWWYIKKKTKKVERKLPEDFQFPVILRFSCFSLFSCNQVTCVKTSFFSPIFQRLEEIMVISCQQTKNAKNEIAAEVFQSICSRFGSYQKQRMNRGIPAALLLIIDRWLRDAMTTESLLLRCFCAALILFMMCDACQQLFPLGW